MTEERDYKTAEDINKETIEDTAGTQNQSENQKAENSEDIQDVKKDEKCEDKRKKPRKDKKTERINELELKLEELSDKHLRLQAEFDNYRRRTIREKAELIRSGGESVIKGILPVIDDFERAIDSMKEISDEDSGKQGILLIYSKFKDFLKQNNVKEIEALHQDFNVDIHEALTKIPAPEEKLKGKIVEVIQKGYTLNDKVIRFAKVVVGE